MANITRQKLAVPDPKGYELHSLKDILFLQSLNGCTVIRFLDKKIISTKTLGEYEKTLNNDRFLRVHNSFIVNIDRVNRIEKNNREVDLILEGKYIIPVSRANRNQVMQLLVD